MSDEKAYRNRVMGIVLLGVIFWLIFGILSRLGIFWFGIDFGFELIVRRVYAVLGLTILIISVILSIITTVAYRQHFPKLNEQIVKGNNQYKELRSFKKIAFWIIMFGVLLQTIVFLLLFYILVITDNLVYDFELLETNIAVIIIGGVIMTFIPIKKVSDQKLESDQKKELDLDKGKEGDKLQKTIKGFSQKTLFKMLLYTLYFIAIAFTLRNFQGIFFSTNLNKLIYYIVLQLISIAFFVGFIWWFFKFRKKYFSLEPDKRKSKYLVKSWIIGIIGFLLIINLMLYLLFFEEPIEILFGRYSFIRLLYDLSLVISFPFWFYGIFMTVVIRARAD